jgi:hypothetical protein
MFAELVTLRIISHFSRTCGAFLVMCNGTGQVLAEHDKY